MAAENRLFNGALKSTLQYLIGVALYVYYYGVIDPIKLVLGLFSFLTAYSSIYYYNDLMDYNEDKKDKIKREYKILIQKKVSIEQAITTVFILSITGLTLSLFVNKLFTLILTTLLVANILHSAPITRTLFKKRMLFLAPNMTLIQFLKPFLAWVSFTYDITKVPVFAILLLSISYVTGYLSYKKDFINFRKTFSKINSMHVLIIICVLLYLVSLVLYPFKITLILGPLLLLLFNISSRYRNALNSYLMINTFLIPLILLFLIILLLVSNVSIISAASDYISSIMESLFLLMPGWIKNIYFVSSQIVSNLLISISDLYSIVYYF